MGLEILERGEINVRRADADELNPIRDGALSYDQLLAVAADLQARMQAAATTTTLPADVDLQRVDALALEAIRAFV